MRVPDEPPRPESVSRCPLCRGTTTRFGEGTVLGDVPVTYMRCSHCASISLPRPTWLDRAYSDAISALDVGLLERCLQLANVTHAVVAAEGLQREECLDFAGGYGTLTRLMRDRGIAFHHADPYCDNIFARGFEGELPRRYALITAFEVLEHLTDPVADLAAVAASTDLLLVTTQVLPDPPPQPGAWDYYAPETGQHVTFSTVAGLRALASALDYRLTTSGRLVHVLHRRPLRRATRILMRDERLAYAVGALRGEVGRRRGLTLADSRSAADAVRRGVPSSCRSS